MSVHSKELVQFIEVNHYITNEVPSGLINGSNPMFTIINTPMAESVQVTLNGLIQHKGIDKDYIVEGKDIVFYKAPRENSEVLVNYLKQ